MTRLSLFRTLFGRAVYLLSGVIVDLCPFAWKVYFLMKISDPVAAAEVKKSADQKPTNQDRVLPL